MGKSHGSDVLIFFLGMRPPHGERTSFGHVARYCQLCLPGSSCCPLQRMALGPVLVCSQETALVSQTAQSWTCESRALGTGEAPKTPHLRVGRRARQCSARPPQLRPLTRGSPELSQRWEPLLLPPLSLPPFVEAASLVGICCCTAACLWIWLVVLSSWMGTSLLAGRLSAGALSRRAMSGRSVNSAPASSVLPRAPGALARVAGPSRPSPLKLGVWLGGWAYPSNRGRIPELSFLLEAAPAPAPPLALVCAVHPHPPSCGSTQPHS